MTLKALPFLAITCLLAACGRTSEAVTPPVAPTPSALYELNFQNLGSAQATASAQRLGGGLGAQRLENAPEPLGLGTTPLSTLEFVTTENGKSVRHAQATFKLTNTSGRALKNLVFLPVALNDTDGDPSNNAQAPTAGGTPFRTVRYFDGSDASALAGTLTPVQGQRLNTDKTAAQADPDADVYFRGLSTAGLNVAAPAGLSVQVTDGGWLAATSLAAGASTNVTFAVDMGGVDPANLKATPYSFSLLVTGGEDATATDLSSSVDPASIQGVIPDWKYGEGQVLGYDYTGPVVVGTVAATGIVGGRLPSAPRVEGLLSGCTFSGESSARNPGLSSFSSTYAVRTVAGDLLGTLRERDTAGQFVLRVYSDTAVRLKGRQICAGFETQLDVSLNRGWNLVNERLVGVDEQDTVTFAVTSVPMGTRTQLQYSPSREGIEVIFDDQGELALRAGQTATRSVRLNQSGAISGDVTLETNVPGVTVTPATLTLPSLETAPIRGQGLRRQGVGAQALARNLTFSAEAEAKAYSGPLTLIVKKGGIEVGRGSLYVSLTVPSVSAYFTTSLSEQTGSLAQGETRDFPVALSSVEGYAGTTTVTLAGLPAGVSATTETVTLTANGQANATIKLTVGPDVTVGTTFDVQVVGPKIVAGSNATQSYSVSPIRTPIALRGYHASAPAASGVWILDRAADNTLTLLRQEGRQTVQRVDLGILNKDPLGSPAYTTRLFSTPGGDALVLTLNDGSTQGAYVFTLTRVGATGERSAVTLRGSDLNYGVLTGKPDAQGNFWFLSNTGAGVALNKASLLTSTAERVTMLTEVDSTNPILSSPDGRTLMIVGSSRLYRIDTATAVVSDAVRNTSQPLPAVLDNSGNWYAVGGGGILRATPAGDTRSYNNTYGYGNIIGIDRADPNSLWLFGGSSFLKLDLTNNAAKATTIYTYSSQSPYLSNAGQSLNGGGGAWLFGSSTTYSGTSTTTYFASLVK
ncbi:hypothetical protein [Deinococcus sp. Leaf326]|uniref:hypothetical protein n=1 Tax=Deinococcus sp. Leaf326 TaxID=1736338 RepID=UPI0006FDFB9E|nr:hypothetical protein [Deinococcus sp. Leaf326]KQR04453.1 hypothetical protein ASF71_10360 [Deinococcus sp. Leaf326]